MTKPLVSQDPALPSFEGLRGHRQVTGLLLPVAVGILAPSCWAMAAKGLEVMRPIGLLLSLLFFVLLGIRRSLTCRIHVPRKDGEPDADGTEVSDDETKTGLETTSEAPKEEGAPKPSLRERLQVGRPDWPCWSVEGEIIRIAVGLGALVTCIGLLQQQARLSASWMSKQAIEVSPTLLGLGVAISLLLVVISIVLVRYLESIPEEDLPDAPGIAHLFRLIVWLSGLAGLSLVLRLVQRPLGDKVLEKVGIWLILILSAELMLRAGWSLIRHREPPDPPRLGVDLLLTRLLGSRFNLASSFFFALERTFGIDIESAWALRFLREAMFPAGLGLLVVCWLLSAVVVVNPTEVAVQERFGRPVGDPIGPGIHLVWPWPVDRLKRVDVLRVRTMPIGYVQAKTGAAMLWTTRHAEEHNLLLGDGRDLVTVNAELFYRISDPHAWLYGCQNPEAAIETLALRILTHETVSRTLDEVLSENLGLLGVRVQEALQAEVDLHALGVEVVAFEFLGLHPPIDVAEDYQAVVSAQVARQTLIIDGQAYQMASMPAAEADAFTILKKAEADGLGRLAEANGESWAFRVVEEEYQLSPPLFRLRRRLETLESALGKRKFWVIDDRYLRDGGEIWLTD